MPDPDIPAQAFMMDLGGARTGGEGPDRPTEATETAGDVIAVVAADGTLVYVSPSFAAVAQIAPHNLIGRFVFDDEQQALFAEVVPRLGGVVVAERVAESGAVARHPSDVVLVLDTERSIVWAGGSVAAALGYRPEALIGRFVFDLVLEDDRAAVRAVIDAAADGHARDDGDVVRVRIRKADDAIHLFELRASEHVGDAALTRVVLTSSEISERQRAEDLLAEEAAVLERIARGVPTNTILGDLAVLVERHVPGAACTVGAMEGDGVIRHPSAPTLPPLLTALLDDVAPSSPLGTVVRVATDIVDYGDIAGDSRWGDLGGALVAHGWRGCWMAPVRSPADQGLIGAVTVFLPMPTEPSSEARALLGRIRQLAAIAIERGRFEAALKHRALHDALTGLPNRTLLLDQLEAALDRSRRNGTRVAVLFIDLDQFKVVNDSLGHDIGDRLLIEVAANLREAVRAGDTVARLGGDEFAVLCEGVTSADDGVVVAEHLRATLSAPFRVAGAELFVTCSVGIAVGSSANAEALIRDADAAMYRAKELGRNRATVFEGAFHERMVRRLVLQREVRSALDLDQLSLRYQPRVRVADGRISGVEALLRWHRPDGELVDTDEVIAVAEETGFILQLGAWVLDGAGRQAAVWSRGGNPVVMAVNLSGRQVVDPGLIPLVSEVCDRHGLDPSLLCLEVTESELAGDTEACAVALAALKELGVRVAIDDFGTGYATLDYVRRFAMADELKIDQSFVAGLSDLDSPDAAIVSAAIVLANALGFETVAEGVETDEQLEVLRRLGCTHVQGNHFSPAVDADEFAELLARGIL